ncbi:transmembrane protein 176A [Sorex araneus]|uniref:transmembrane protein 176A n=1 Tax=Sorex araneus TaxID=42254 RepID=UPI0024337C97|nr:transmembrane protein 176A [Sorex araneus]
MPAGMDAAEGSDEVAPGGPQPTSFNVHIHQESALAQLLKGLVTRLQAPRPAAPSRGARLLAASWAAQIVLGGLALVLGGFLYLCQYSSVRYSGAAFWTGGVAVLAGAVAFIYEKRRGIFWAFLRTLLIVAVFTTAVIAIVILANHFYEFRYFYNGNEICDVSRGGWPTQAPTTASPEETQREDLCHSYVRFLQAMSISLHATLFALWVLLILTSLTPLGLFFWTTCISKKKTDQKKLLPGNDV